MPKFFVKNSQINGTKVIILGEDVNHIKNVLRLKVDNDIQVCNSDTKENYICGITSINNENIECTIFKTLGNIAEGNVYINVFQGIPKADKMELIIQKSVELGASEITPIEMKRCVAKIEEKAQTKKLLRWQKISEVAAKQSGRDIIPKVNSITSIKNICNTISEYDIVLLAYENEKTNTLKNELTKLKSLNKNLKIGIIIGPEGRIRKRGSKYIKRKWCKSYYFRE